MVSWKLRKIDHDDVDIHIPDHGEYQGVMTNGLTNVAESRRNALYRELGCSTFPPVATLRLNCLIGQQVAASAMATFGWYPLTPTDARMMIHKAVHCLGN